MSAHEGFQKICQIGLIGLIGLVGPAFAGSSANYTLAPDAIDHGGLRGASASYSLNASNMPGGHGTSSAYTLRTGFAGQLADAIATSINLSASPLTVNEGGTRQISASLVFDDLSSQPIAPVDVTWSIQSGPIASITPGGLVTAAIVPQDTAAMIRGDYQGLSGSLVLHVLDSRPDNFGAYATDGIDDAWQVLHFGLPPNAGASPSADPDADGQNNQFEFIAGTTPNDPWSAFRVNAALVPGQPGHKRVIFSPRLHGRTYVVQFSTTLQAQSWMPLTNHTTNDDGITRTVTDPDAAVPRKMYRVEISRP